MRAHLYFIDCLTNLHVGNGDVNYNIIDNEVEKDSVLKDVPVIHASGVKGALKEFLEGKWEERDEKIVNIFGNKDKPGHYNFLSACLIVRPLRVSAGNRPYILTTSVDVLEHLCKLFKGVGIEAFDFSGIKRFNDNLFHVSTDAVTSVEGVNAVRLPPNFQSLNGFICDEYAVINTLRDYDLPALARNVLDEKGLSENVWYEEIVPHKSRFCFIILTPDNDPDYEAFKDAIENKGPIQFGGNASVGYGFTTVMEARHE